MLPRSGVRAPPRSLGTSPVASARGGEGERPQGEFLREPGAGGIIVEGPSGPEKPAGGWGVEGREQGGESAGRCGGPGTELLEAGKHKDPLWNPA